MISVCIPIHDQPQGAFMLSRLLQSLSQQTSVQYEMVIVKEGMVGHNLNEGIKKCRGDIIKIMCQDDWFAHPHVLKNVQENFTGGWLVAGSHNNQNPIWTDDLYLGVNKLGGLSSVAFQNFNAPKFDEDLEWMIDIDFYMKLYKQYGKPTILSGLNINIGIHENQLSITLPNERKMAEHRLIAQRYE